MWVVLLGASVQLVSGVIKPSSIKDDFVEFVLYLLNQT